MSGTFDVVVVGGGLIGAWTALELTRRSRRVALIEKGVVGAQSSGVNFGSLRLQGRYPAQYPLSMRAQEMWERFNELIGEGCEYDRSGHLYCAVTQEEAEGLHHYADISRENGLAVEILEGDALFTRFPWLSREIRVASHSARDANANPRLATPAVARAARAAGVTVMERTEVRAIDPAGDGFEVRLDTGTLSAGHVVNAAGAWSVAFAERFGESVPVLPAGPPQFVTEPLPYTIRPTVQRIDGSVIARQIPRGNVVVAGYPRTQADPVANRAPVPPWKTLATMAALAGCIPILSDAQIIRVWSGIEAYIPDMIPVIGESLTQPGLIHAFGFCGHGFQIAPGVAACIADLVIDGATATPLAAFSIGRFAGERVISEKFRREFDAEAVGG
ncbi:NAD(P)/FAD-dependent oxidoreductase [Acuticoccus kandeliae]|uniref:NAD(P)/FAD-dependent oxidoreductase n=1 Tax=Acuticoccus kandeliae TaxID=2073160 RepID=UPI000D3E4D1B|nr:FAD-binding oxidoreductase [Acuticoccus kandeliae]